MIPTPSEIMLLELLRSALWRKEIDTTCFATATQEQWEEIVRLAIAQGIQAVCYDALIHLEDDLQPPRKVKLQWAISVKALEKRFLRHLHTAAHLASFYQERGLKMMLMKGLGLAQLYPEPMHRESGDLDIWLFGEYKKGNKLMEEKGIKVNRHGSKHACFYFEGTPIENHKSFLNIDQFRIDREILEPALQQALEQTQCIPFALPEKASLLLPPATFSAIFLARHMSNHFVGGIVLRHLCDWARFLYSCHKEYDADKLSALFEKAGMLPLMQCFTELAIEQLGMPQAFSPFTGKADEALKTRVWQDILRPSFPVSPEGQGVLRIITYKWKRLMDSRNYYELVHGEGFTRRLITSAVSHLLHPETILKLK